MTNVVCVLRSGGEYTPWHVARLARQVVEHGGPRITCFTDLVGEVIGASSFLDRAISLAHGWPGWWSKMEMFRLPGPALYLDLDVTVCGPLDELLATAACTDFVACANFWVRDPHAMNSSVMAWSGDQTDLHDAFASDPAAWQAAYRTPDRWGDQAFIADRRPDRRHWQDLLPGRVLSYKRDILNGADRHNARVIVHHGKPKPWDLEVDL